MATSPEKKTILAFGAGTWRWHQVNGSTRYHLWTLARRHGWRVVYVEPSTALSFSFSGRERSNPESASANFHVLTPALVPPFAPRAVPIESIGEIWRGFTAHRMAEEAKKFLAKNNLTADTIWYGAPWHGAIAQHFAGTPSVFHVYDELALSPALSRWRQRLLWKWECELLSHVDIALCSSQPQLERRKSLAKQTLLLENAIPENYGENYYGRDPWTEFEWVWIGELPRPRLMYGGVIDLRMDPALVKALLDSDQVGSVVFIGPIDESADGKLKLLLRRHPKAHTYGALPYLDFPMMYELADALILLHKINPFTEGMYPEKLNEYLASGKPILSVPLSEVHRIAAQGGREGVVRFAESATHIHDALAQCLADDDPALAQERIALARRHTWSQAGEKLDAALRELLA